jgi:hypothetical protein
MIIRPNCILKKNLEIRSSEGVDNNNDTIAIAERIGEGAKKKASTGPPDSLYLGKA